MIGADDQVVTPALVLGASANQLNEGSLVSVEITGDFHIRLPPSIIPLHICDITGSNRGQKMFELLQVA